MAFGRIKSMAAASIFGALSRRLWRTSIVVGPAHRLTTGDNVVRQNTLFNTLSGRIDVGSNTCVGHGVMVLTGTHDFTTTAPEERAHSVPSTGFDIRIGKNVWVGSGAIVVGPAVIGDDAIVGAGSLVRGVVPAAAKFAGVPARSITRIEITPTEKP